jgi:hypothetical protein
VLGTIDSGAGVGSVMNDIAPIDVRRLVADVLRSHILDEPDLCHHVRPFMRSVGALGLRRNVVAPALLETYRAARQAVDRLSAERSMGLRPPAPIWPQDEEEALDDPETLIALYPPSPSRRT